MRGVYDWQSVVEHGTFHRIDLVDGTAREQAAGVHAVHLLQQIVPETWMPGDPVAFRTVLFRIAIGEVNGREAKATASGALADVADAPVVEEARPRGAERRNHSGW